MENLEFKESAPFTLGVELELQLVNSRDFDLTPAASDLLAIVEKREHPGCVKPEITESMIEISTSVHMHHAELLAELEAIRNTLVDAAGRLNVDVAGGGAHPFQHWAERRIVDKPRFLHLSKLYGYLAKQFTVFGQHIHIGCASGDDALYLLHAMSRYVPHFIALSAASPYYQGVDTAFDSSRLNSVSAFPLSGRAPFVWAWSDFNSYFARMRDTGIVESMKDFYWDIRPKPEYGTIEIRVCDTPLSVRRAAALAAYAQALGRWLLLEHPQEPSEEAYLAYSFNRYQACRFGLEGEMLDPIKHMRRAISDDILATIGAVAAHGQELEIEEALASIRSIIRDGNDAQWMRASYSEAQSLRELVWRQVVRFRDRE